MKRIILAVAVLIFTGFQAFYYDTEYLDRSDFSAIEEMYSLDVGIREAWYAAKYSKYTLIFPREPMIEITSSIGLFPDESTWIQLSMTHGENLIETALPFAPAKLSETIRMTEELLLNETNVQVDIISSTGREGFYTPYYQFTFRDNGTLYRVEFKTDCQSHQYHSEDTEMNQQHLEVYLQWIKEHILDED